MKLFLFRNHIFDPKKRNNFNYVYVSLFEISLKLAENFKRYNLLPNLYPLRKVSRVLKVVTFANRVVASNRLNPLIVATRKVKICKFYHYFHQQSSIKSFINKHN